MISQTPSNTTDASQSKPVTYYRTEFAVRGYENEQVDNISISDDKQEATISFVDNVDPQTASDIISRLFAPVERNGVTISADITTVVIDTPTIARVTLTADT